MKSFAVLVLAASASLVAAAPTPLSMVKRDGQIDDVTIFRTALTLEFLEQAFYKEALDKFDDKAFEDAGFPPFVRGRYKQILEHEETHVDAIKAVLGTQAVEACTYSFPYGDVKSFVTLSQDLEDVGQAAYQGAAPYLQNKSLLAAATSILVTESKHEGWISSAVQHQEPWSGPFGVALSLRAIVTLASKFIVSCPATNPPLIEPFKALTLDPPAPSAGSQVTLKYDDADNGSGPLFLAVVSGSNTIFIEVKDKVVTLPEGLQGFIYLLLATNNDTLADEHILAGPARLHYEFESTASNP